jgi:glycosyltransferase involved in cell wall biosynthesis
MKIALISRPLPPSPSGQAMMLYRLLKDVDPGKYVLITGQSSDHATEETSYSQRLPGKYFYLSTEREYRQQFATLYQDSVNITLGTYRRARQIARIIRDEKCDAVVSCSSGDDRIDVPSGLVAGRLAHVPFYVYLFDTYSHMWIQPRSQFIGRWLEPFILKRAAGVITTNDFVQQMLRERYGVESVVIHNPCDLTAYERPLTEAEKAEPPDDDVRIVFTGSVFEAHFEAFRNLIEALRRIGRPEIKVHIYTAQPAFLLERAKVTGPVVIHQHETVFAMPGIQRRAAILFLPLAFNTPYPELIRVSSPSKIGEYLAAGRPILVHAPPDSFIATYFRRHECGLVVDRNDPGAVAEAVEKLLADKELQQRLIANAWERVHADFSLPAAREKFAQFMKFDELGEERE